MSILEIGEVIYANDPFSSSLVREYSSGTWPPGIKIAIYSYLTTQWACD
jgi:hypothetical protein